MGRADHPTRLTLTEVLVEPGAPQIWVSSGTFTHHIDLTPLLNLKKGMPLRLSRNRKAVSIAPDAESLSWPGLTLHWSDLQDMRVCQMPVQERYRPLLPYMRAHEPHLAPVAPITPSRLQLLLSLKTHQIEEAARSLNVSPDLANQRLYDIGIVLREYIGHDAMLSLLRRPWPIAARLSHPLFHNMQSCLIHGRPDLVEKCLVKLILEGMD